MPAVCCRSRPRPRSPDGTRVDLLLPPFDLRTERSRSRRALWDVVGCVGGRAFFRRAHFAAVHTVHSAAARSPDRSPSRLEIVAAGSPTICVTTRSPRCIRDGRLLGRRELDPGGHAVVARFARDAVTADRCEGDGSHSVYPRWAAARQSRATSRWACRHGPLRSRRGQRQLLRGRRLALGVSAMGGSLAAASYTHVGNAITTRFAAGAAAGDLCHDHGSSRCIRDGRRVVLASCTDVGTPPRLDSCTTTNRRDSRTMPGRNAIDVCDFPAERPPTLPSARRRDRRTGSSRSCARRSRTGTDGPP